MAAQPSQSFSRWSRSLLFCRLRLLVGPVHRHQYHVAPLDGRCGLGLSAPQIVDRVDESDEREEEPQEEAEGAGRLNSVAVVVAIASRGTPERSQSDRAGEPEYGCYPLKS